jgi:hypothetical protein
VVWDLRLHGEPGGPTSITGTARFMLAIFYIVTTPLQDTREVPKLAVHAATRGDRMLPGSGMIAAMSLRLLYLIFQQMLRLVLYWANGIYQGRRARRAAA